MRGFQNNASANGRIGWTPLDTNFAASVDSGLKELITFRESRAQMIAPLPMVLAGLAAFPGLRAARLRRVASFGLSWRPAAFRLYQEYLDEEAALRRDSKEEYKYFNTFNENAANDSSRFSSEINILRAKMAELERRLDERCARDSGLNAKDYQSALQVFVYEPRMALVKNRTIVEHICKILYERELGKPFDSPHPMLGQMLRKLIDNSSVPENILALLTTVNGLAGAAGHASAPGKIAATLDEAEFSVSFTATLRITEWFITDYLYKHRSVMHDKSPGVVGGA